MSFPPVWTPESRVLILGTYPSPLSREVGFYYGHPRNRFWPLMAAMFGCEFPATTDERRILILSHKIALWDVLENCDIDGASDNTIANPVPNDLEGLLAACRIEQIYANGAKAAELYRHFYDDKLTVPFKRLPSTSPANARFSFDRLLEEWSCIKEHLE